MTSKQQAFNLYFQSNLTQQQIADMLDINRKTLYTWIRAGDWKRARHTARHAPTLLVQQYYDQLTAMNAHIAARTEQPFPTKDEADVMRKLSMVIKQLRISWTPSDMMDIFTLFQSDLVRSGQTDKATELMPLLDNFVQKSSVGSRSYEPLREYYDGQIEDEEYERWLSEQKQQTDAAANEADSDQLLGENISEPNCNMNCHTEPEFTPMHRCRSGAGVTSDALNSEPDIEKQKRQTVVTQTEPDATPPNPEPAPIKSEERGYLPADRQGERSHRVEMGHDENATECSNQLENSRKEQMREPEPPKEKLQNGVVDEQEEVTETNEQIPDV